MAPPVAAFTVIPLADVDPDSPVTTDLMNALRLNDQNLFAQLVGDPVAAPPFTPAAAHNHDGVNSAAVAVAALFGSAVFDLVTSGTTPVSTGALAFIPKVAIVVGVKTLTDNSYVGFAIGTGALAKSLAWESGTGTPFSVDADSIGGDSAGTPGTAHGIDLNVTNFAQGAPGIEFTPASGTGVWTFKVLVFGFTN